MNSDILQRQAYDILSEKEIEQIPAKYRSWDSLIHYQNLSPEFLLRHREEIQKNNFQFPAIRYQIVPKGMLNVPQYLYYMYQRVNENLIGDDGSGDFRWDKIFEWQFNLSEQFILNNWNKVDPMTIARYQTWPKSKPIINNPLFFQHQAIEGGDVEQPHPYSITTQIPQKRTADFFENSFIQNLEPFVQDLFDKEAWRAICTRHKLSNDFIIRYRNFGTFSFGSAHQNYSLETLSKYAKHVNWYHYFEFNKHITKQIFWRFYHCRFFRSARHNPACKHWLEPGVVEYEMEQTILPRTLPNHSSLYLASALNLPQNQNMMHFNVDVDTVKEMLLADNVVLEVVLQETRPTIKKSFWRFIWKWCTLSEEFIEKIAFPNWLHVVKYQNLSTDFINKNWDKLPLEFLARYQKLDTAQVERLLAYEDTAMDRLLLRFQTSQLIKLRSNPFVEFILDQYEISQNPPTGFRYLLQKSRPADFKYNLRDFWPLDYMMKNHQRMQKKIGTQPIPFEFFEAHPEYVHDRYLDMWDLFGNTIFPEWFLEKYRHVCFNANIAMTQKLSLAFIKKWWRRLDMDTIFAFQEVDREIVERFFNPRQHHYFEVLRNPRSDEIIKIIQSVYPKLRQPLMYYNRFEFN